MFYVFVFFSSCFVRISGCYFENSLIRFLAVNFKIVVKIYLQEYGFSHLSTPTSWFYYNDSSFNGWKMILKEYTFWI